MALFSTLWGNYPSQMHPCNGPWANQCAIRLSIALTAGGIAVNAGTYSEPKCAHGHARGAESLANWLWRKHLRAPRRWTSGATAKTAIDGKTGIIFFKDCFTRTGETTPRGDHIDLWKSDATKTFSDPGNAAREVWFWELL